MKIRCPAQTAHSGMSWKLSSGLKNVAGARGGMKLMKWGPNMDEPQASTSINQHQSTSININHQSTSIK